MENSQNPPPLRRKKSFVKISDEELLLMLRAYIVRPSQWYHIVNEVKANTSQLDQPAQALYRTASHKQLRDRLTTKLNLLLSKTPESIKNEELRTLVQRISGNETALVDERNVVSIPANDLDVANQTGAHGDQDMRRQAMDQMPDSTDEDEPRARELAGNDPAAGPANDQLAGNDPAAGPANDQLADNDHAGGPANDQLAGNDPAAGPANGQPQPNRRRKRPLRELVRENHELYNKFLHKKMPKILRELGISSSDSE